MFKLIIVSVLALAAFAAYKLWKSGKAVTTRNVIAEAEQTAKTAATAVKKKLKK